MRRSPHAFDSFFDVFFEIRLEPLSPGEVEYLLHGSDHFVTAGTWAGIPVGPGLEKFMVTSPLVAQDADGNILYLDPIPEPVTAAGLMLAFGVLGAYVRRRRR